MASLLICNSATLTLSILKTPTTRASFKSSLVLNSPAIRFAATGHFGRQKTRGVRVVTRAGPSTSSYVFAFVLPFSLLAITIFASVKIADKLDREFLEDLAINEAIREAEGEEDGDVGISLEEEPALPRTRNRPKREA
ncbi:hypothetical protein L1049_011708 [Liquidambar formosana]|uniref:High chlorophyll fluorescence 153 n=1 Tax=Liquidambar formosana TaxID=63359 RepID=A0AAP0X2G5_LIQFO